MAGVIWVVEFATYALVNPPKNWQPSDCAKMNAKAPKIFCWLFVLSVFIVSPLYSDLYPFSTFPMFSDREASFLELSITGPEGESLHPSNYGMEKLQFANRDCRYGYRRPICYFDKYSQVEPSHVQAFLKEHYPNNAYPIEIVYKVRGYCPERKEVVDLIPLTKFSVDGGQQAPNLKVAIQ